MKQYNNIIYCILFILTLLFYNKSYSIDCPPPQELVTLPFYNDYLIEFPAIDIQGSIDMNKGILNSQPTIVIDESSFVGLNLFSGKTFDQVKGFIISYLALEYVEELNSTNPCPYTNNITISFIFKKECRIGRRCWFRVDETQEALCTDVGFPGPIPEIETVSGVKYYAHYWSDVCGEKCCEWLVTVNCKDESDPTGSNNFKITSVEKQTLSGSDCPISNEVDCRKGIPMPCNGSCD